MRFGKYESSDNGYVGHRDHIPADWGWGPVPLAGLLLAPKSGKLLRKDLKRGLGYMTTHWDTGQRLGRRSQEPSQRG